MSEVVTHPLTDAQIETFWPGADPAEIREQFGALMRQAALVWHRSFPRHHELFAAVAAKKSEGLEPRIAALETAIAGMPEHWHQWQWVADAKPVFGDRLIRSVYGDNGHGMGRQAIAALPSGKEYFRTLADFIAAANPDTIVMLLAELRRLQAENEQLRGVA